MKRRTWLGMAAIALGTMTPLHAQEAFPSKPIKIIVGYAPGGSSDITARLIADRLRIELGQPIIVDNRPGAGGNIGAEAVARATPDGYTLLLAAAAQIVVNPSLYKNMPLDPLKDLAPITQLQTDHNLMVVNPSVPAKNVAEFIAYAKTKPKGITFASPGSGSPAHLAGELMNQMAGLTMQHIPYKGSGPALNDLIAGHVTMAIDNMPALLPQVKSGKLRALAVASTKRATAAPDIPTVDEAGLKGYVVTAWKGLMAPAGTPAPVIAKLHDVTVKVLADPEIRKRMIALGAEPVGDTPAHFAQTLREETAKWAALVKSTGASIE
ncbi:MAG: Bug family tripartite tricarboxylate transporter substrate binding protein [Cupriavidus necator]